MRPFVSTPGVHLHGGDYTLAVDEHHDPAFPVAALSILDATAPYTTEVARLLFTNRNEIRAFAERILAAVPACAACGDTGSTPDLSEPCSDCHGYPTPEAALIQGFEVAA